MFKTEKKNIPYKDAVGSMGTGIVKKKREKKNSYMLPYKKPMWIGCSIMMSMERAHGNKDIHECVTSGGILIKLTIGLRESLWATEVPLVVVLLESATPSD